MTTLLEKALATSRSYANKKHTLSQEDVDLALAWVKGEITLKQVNAAYGLKTTNTTSTYHISRAIRYGVETGKLLIIRDAGKSAP